MFPPIFPSPTKPICISVPPGRAARSWSLRKVLLHGDRCGPAHHAEHVHDPRVELAPGAAPELVERLGLAEHAPVRAHLAHRAVRVADGDDPGAERDRLALQLVGVAAAVPALVAGAYEQPDLAQ